MKNIFYIANIRMPTEKAHGIQIMKMCEAFTEEGKLVQLIVPTRKTEIETDPFDYFRVKKNFSIVKLWCLDVVKIGKFGFWIEILTFTNSVLTYLKGKEGIFYTRDEVVAYFLQKSGREVIWEVHMGQDNYFVKKLDRKSKIVAITHGLKELYVEKGFNPENILVAPDAVDLNEFNVKATQIEAREKLGLPKDIKIAMYIGLLDKWKGIDTFLEASKLISDVKFVVIGGKKEQIEKYKVIYPGVTFLGYRPYSELPVNQKAADVLVIPNSAKEKISSLYTSPIKLFAHMVSGVPLLVSELPSMREIIDETCSYFFKADDPRDMANLIATVLKDPSKLEKATYAQKKVKKYSWQKRANNIVNFVT